MKTYVVNLEKSTDRKKYMTRLLADQPFLDVEFINAVDGRIYVMDVWSPTLCAMNC